MIAFDSNSEYYLLMEETKNYSHIQILKLINKNIKNMRSKINKEKINLNFNEFYIFNEEETKVF